MKIYAKTNKSTFEFLKRFIGTDLWVRCKHITDGQCFLHLISIDDKYVHIEWVGDIKFFEDSQEQYVPQYHKSRVFLPGGSFDFLWNSVCKPLEILTTDEIHEIYGNLI